MLTHWLPTAFACALSLFPQGTPPKTPVRPTGTAVISGRVIDGSNEQRIGGAIVTLTGGGLIEPERVTADADGLFNFRNLPDGTFVLTARRTGFVEANLGQRRPGGPSRQLTLAAGDRRDDLELRMFRASAITGTVTDDVGEPMVKSLVRVYQRVFVGGRAVLVNVAEDITDDRGIYRIGRLTPGEFIVSAPMMTNLPSPGSPLSSSLPITPRDGGASASYLPPANGTLQKFPTVYYQSGRNASEAAVVTLGIGELKRSIDIQLRPQKAVNITGTVTSTNAVSRGVEVALVAQGEDEVGGDRAVATSIVGASGSFGFPAIPSGQYVIRALMRPRGGADEQPTQWSEQSISVTDKDVSEVTLLMRRGLRVGGRVAFDGAADDTGQWLGGVSVSLDAASIHYSGVPLPVSAVDAASRTFDLVNVLPGRYLVRVKPPAGRYVKSVTYQGRDVSQSALLIDSADVSGLVITLTDRPTLLKGTVSDVGDVSAASVLVFPQDPQAWTDFGAAPVTFRTVNVTAIGTFEVLGLPAGDYLAVAIDPDTAVDAQNPDFLRAAARVAVHVRLGDGEQQHTDLKTVIIK